MISACVMGLRYYAIVFAVAFAMGIARTLVIAPRLGATAAVLLEVPVIVAVSWAVWRRLIRQRSLTMPQRAVVGATALLLTMASEVVLARLLRGQTAMDWLSDVVTPLGMIGLAGQIAFALIPMLVEHRCNHLGPDP